MIEVPFSHVQDPFVSVLSDLWTLVPVQKVIEVLSNTSACWALFRVDKRELLQSRGGRTGLTFAR